MALKHMQTDTQVVFHSHSGEKRTDWAASVLAHLEGAERREGVWSREWQQRKDRVCVTVCRGGGMIWVLWF